MLTIDEKKKAICETLEMYSNSSWDEIIRELGFLENQEKFYYSSDKCPVSGGIQILCNDFSVGDILSERKSLELLCDELTRIIDTNEKRYYGFAMESEVWTPGKFYDLRNTVREVIKIFGEADFSSDLSRNDRKAIFELLSETPANRDHWSF